MFSPLRLFARNRKACPPIAVIWCGPDGDERAIVHDLVPLHDELMRACNELEIVIMDKLVGDVASEQVACASWGEAPACNVVRV